MELYFLKIETFLKELDENFLSGYREEKKDACIKRQNEYALGRFLLTQVLTNFYDIKNPKILIKNDKPYLDDGSIFFSLSHSKGIVAVVFDSSEVGFDIEFMKKRDFKLLIERYDIDVKDDEKTDFYSFWTSYEAEIKLQKPVKSQFDSCFYSDYWMSIKSENNVNIKDVLKVYELLLDQKGQIKRNTCQNFYTK